MDFLQQLFGTDLQAAGFIILNLIIIESLLSVDNAAVLATMVMDLDPKQRGKALQYGIIGAYVFRGICLLLAAWLVTIWWLKPLGGLYLVYLAFNYFKSQATEDESDDAMQGQENWVYKNTIGLLGKFWATVALVEVMDLAFSIDNVFAAVAFSDKIVLVITGVFIGILAMRFVAQAFVRLMERYPFLETAAFTVIGLLGIKLLLSLYTHFYPEQPIAKFLDGEEADLYVSITTIAIFALPILTSALFNVPKRHVVEQRK